MRIFLFLCLSFVSINNVFAEHLDLDQLLQAVKQSQGKEGKINREREARFLADNNQQKQLLATAKADLAKQESLSSQLKAKLEANEEELSNLETELNDRSGVLGELFGVARQAAGDLKAELDNSIISAEFPGRTKQLNSIANSKALPTIDELETLWVTLLQEMAQSGKVVNYDSTILSASGEPMDAKVFRIGTFTALANGKYLRYLPETGKLVELNRQPTGKYLGLVEDFEETTQGEVEIAIDPTRGVILSMLIQVPDTFERIQQGGIIGYIILTLGALGFIYAIIRLISLTLTGQKITLQLSNPEALDDNPLGRIMAATEQGDNQTIENLELTLDEAVIKDIPSLEKGLSLIKLLAAVAPLLGLLGTVTGMIATFQSISLFGTGDPKLMASGISQALVTTMLGLCVAIPLLFLHSLVASRSRTLVQILDEQSAGIISLRAEK